MTKLIYIKNKSGPNWIGSFDFCYNGCGVFQTFLDSEDLKVFVKKDILKGWWLGKHPYFVKNFDEYEKRIKVT